MPKYIVERDMRVLEVVAVIDPTTGEAQELVAGRPAARALGLAWTTN
jgi:hypothetical protein